MTGYRRGRAHRPATHPDRVTRQQASMTTHACETKAPGRPAACFQPGIRAGHWKQAAVTANGHPGDESHPCYRQIPLSPVRRGNFLDELRSNTPHAAELKQSIHELPHTYERLRRNQPPDEDKSNASAVILSNCGPLMARNESHRSLSQISA